MRIEDIDRVASSLAGVASRTTDGLTSWRYHGRLVARQLDETSVVIRTAFHARTELLRRSPQTFSVPARYERHMMVVADLSGGDPEVIEDAVVAAWQLQSHHLA